MGSKNGTELESILTFFMFEPPQPERQPQNAIFSQNLDVILQCIVQHRYIKQIRFCHVATTEKCINKVLKVNY